MIQPSPSVNQGLKYDGPGDPSSDLLTIHGSLSGAVTHKQQRQQSPLSPFPLALPPLRATQAEEITSNCRRQHHLPRYFTAASRGHRG